jgi:hypothetical protein
MKVKTFLKTVIFFIITILFIITPSMISTGKEKADSSKRKKCILLP